MMANQEPLLSGQSSADALVDVSLGWEAARGYDSIPTIQRVYEQTRTGAYVCCYPCCGFKRRDPADLWRHVHTAHAPDSCLPPRDFDPGPWL